MGRIDLKISIWQKPPERGEVNANTRVPLAETTVKILREMKAQATSQYLFPAVAGKAKYDIDRPWAGGRQTANREDFRLHGLRDSYVSTLVRKGVSCR